MPRMTIAERLRLRARENARVGLQRDGAALMGAAAGPMIRLGGRHYISFVGNDSLGLASDPAWRAAVARCFALRSPSGRASRLAGGRSPLADDAEQAFADYFGFDECLFFPSGYQANLAAVTALLPRGHDAFADRRVHASVARALPLAGARIHAAPHNDISRLRRRLAALPADAPQPVVVTESLFSMDGDAPDMEALAGLCREQEAFLLVDEAHALGAWGRGGRGFACGDGKGTAPLAHAVVGTLGKALGFWGAFLLLPRGFRDLVEENASAVMHSTTLPEAHAAACLELARRLPGYEEQRERLHANTALFRRLLRERDVPARGLRHIVAIPVGDENAALRLAAALREEGVLALAARYPTVPCNDALLRFSVTALHTPSMLRAAADALARRFPRTRDGAPPAPEHVLHR